MTALTPGSSSNSSASTTAQWEAIGVWPGGTAAAVALAGTAQGAYGLLASAAGAYGWRQPGDQVAPAVEGLNDLNLVAVALAAGDAGPTAAFAATATGRLYVATPDAATIDAATIDAATIDTTATALTWRELSAWAGLGIAVVLAPSPAYGVDHTLFVGTPVGIFRTQDGGQSWESCNFGLLDEEALCIVCAPNFAESEILWAGTAGGGLYRSRNGARAWRESGFGLPDAAVQALAVSPNFAVDQTLLAGMEGHGIYISHDGGASWAEFALAGQSVNTLAWAHTDWVWAGTEDGLWRIAADGKAEQVAAAGATVMSVAATGQGHVALGLYGDGLWLTDEGHTSAENMPWLQPEVPLHAPPVVTGVDDTLFALDGDGAVARTLDGGAQWVALENDLSGMVFALGSTRIAAADGAADVVLFAARESGLARWDEATETWLAYGDMGGGDTAQEAALGVALSPAFGDDKTLLVMGHNSVLRLSQDGGKTWQPVNGPWLGQSLLQARFGPDSSRDLVAVTVQPTEAGHFALTIWESADQGESWEVLAGLSSAVPATLLAWPHDSAEQAIFLATQHRVIKLFHQGDTLQVHQHFFTENLRVTALATAPDYVHSQIVWSATSGGLYRSVDRGETWALILDLPQGLPVVWLHVTLTHISAITLGGRVWRAAL